MYRIIFCKMYRDLYRFINLTKQKSILHNAIVMNYRSKHGQTIFYLCHPLDELR